jgi:membrane fusion protein
MAALEQEQAETDARERVVVTAPTAGVVSAVNWAVGTAVGSGQTLATIVGVAADVARTEGSANSRPHPSGARKPNSVPIEAHLYCSSQKSGFVQIGNLVSIQVHAFPYQKFGMLTGRVKSVSQTPTPTADLPVGHQQAVQSAAMSSEPLYRVTVALDADEFSAYGRVFKVMAGTSVDAQVVQSSRTLLEWLFEPLTVLKREVGFSM